MWKKVNVTVERGRLMLPRQLHGPPRRENSPTTSTSWHAQLVTYRCYCVFRIFFTVYGYTIFGDPSDSVTCPDLTTNHRLYKIMDTPWHHSLVCGLTFGGLEFDILTVAILDFWSQKWPYLGERVELTLMLAATLISTVHLQSMVNCDSEKLSSS